MKFRVAVSLDVKLSGLQPRILTNRETADRVCTALSLLLFDLVEAAAFFDPSKSLSTGVEVRKAEPGDEFATLLLRDGGTPEFHLTTRDLENILAFVLRYCRDGYGAVDHVDIEASVVGRDGESYYFTVAVAEAAAPVTPEEARRRLGLRDA